MYTTTSTEKTDELLQLLSHSHRRQALRFLRKKPNHTATVDELLESTCSSSGGSVSEMEMHHVHIPKLDESELVKLDSQGETIQYYPDTLCEELLQVLIRHDRQSPRT